VPAGLKKVPCDQPHAWEVWALEPLPANVTSVDYQTVSSNPTVRNACSVLLLYSVNSDVFGWQVDVLPPTADAFKAGDRTVRCLAGPSGGRSTGAKFGH
jgi:hypothetical protein